MTLTSTSTVSNLIALGPDWVHHFVIPIVMALVSLTRIRGIDRWLEAHGLKGLRAVLALILGTAISGDPVTGLGAIGAHQILSTARGLVVRRRPS